MVNTFFAPGSTISDINRSASWWLPFVIIAFLFVVALGASVASITIIIGLVFTPLIARTVRAAVLVERHMDYVPAARLLGENSARVMFAEILPNVLPAILVEFTVRLSYAVFALATLLVVTSRAAWSAIRPLRAIDIVPNKLDIGQASRLSASRTASLVSWYGETPARLRRSRNDCRARRSSAACTRHKCRTRSCALAHAGSAAAVPAILRRCSQ